MKSFIIMLLMVLFGLSEAFSQVRMNHSFSEIKEEFKYGYNLQVMRSTDDVVYIVVEFDDRALMYFFNDEMYCKITVVVPKTTGTIQAIIEKYNRELTIISPTKWRFYKSGVYSEVTFENRAGTDVFIWEVVD